MTDTTPGTDGAAGVAATDDDLSVVRAVTDGVQTLIIADFADTASALDAYQGLKALQDGRTVEVEGAIVVSRDADGTLTVQEATDHSTGRGATWGAIGGAVLGSRVPALDHRWSRGGGACRCGHRQGSACAPQASAG